MNIHDDINDAHALNSDCENLVATLSGIAWFYCQETYGPEEQEQKRHRDALIGISDAFERLKKNRWVLYT